jgi:hypothetical protein
MPDRMHEDIDDKMLTGRPSGPRARASLGLLGDLSAMVDMLKCAPPCFSSFWDGNFKKTSSFPTRHAAKCWEWSSILCAPHQASRVFTTQVLAEKSYKPSSDISCKKASCRKPMRSVSEGGCSLHRTTCSGEGSKIDQYAY